MVSDASISEQGPPLGHLPLFAPHVYVQCRAQGEHETSDSQETPLCSLSPCKEASVAPGGMQRCLWETHLGASWFLLSQTHHESFHMPASRRGFFRPSAH